MPTREPPRIPAAGASTRSERILPSIRRTSSMAAKAAKKAPRGSVFQQEKRFPLSEKQPEANSLAKAPTVPAMAAERAARELSSRRQAIPMPMPAPVRAMASCPR